MEPKGDAVDIPEAGAKQITDPGSSSETLEERDVKPPVGDVEATPSSVVVDALDNRVTACLKLENGSGSPMSLPSALCAEEGLASRIGLVELGKGPEPENGKPCDAMTSASQPRCSTADSCVGTESSIIDLVQSVDASLSTEPKGDLGQGESSNALDVGEDLLPAVPNGNCSNEKVETASPVCVGGNKAAPCPRTSPSAAEKGCAGDGQPVFVSDTGQGVSSDDVGMKDSGASGCVVSNVAVESPFAAGRAKKRRVEEGVSDVDGGKLEGETVGDQWRKRRKRKSRRKTSNVSVSPSSVSSSGDEREVPSRPQNGRKPSTEEAAVSEDEQQFCLRWNNFLTNITSQFGTLRDDEDFVDVTLACGGMHVKAHRVVLSACSPYFKRMFKSVPYCQHPVVFLEGIHPSHLLSLLAFMYCGEVGVGRGQLPSLLSAAHALQIRGLTEMGSSGSGSAARSGEEDEDEERVILSARRQAMAVEKVLKDIGFSEAEGTRGGCVMNLPKSSSATRGERVSSVARQKVVEAKLSGAEGTSLSNGLGEPKGIGPCSNGKVPGPLGAELNEDDERNRVRCSERRRWSSTSVKCRSPSPLAPSQLPLVSEGAEMDTPLVTHCSKKSVRDMSNLLNCGMTSEDSVNRVNSNRPDTLLMCNMAASLVDVHMAPSPVAEDGDRGKNLRDAVSESNPQQSSPAPDALGTGMERHGWDPGDDVVRGIASHLEPRIDLVMGPGLIKPKEEFTQFGSDVDDNMSLPNIIEPKMEYQEVSSPDEGETSMGVPQVAAASGPALSLVSINEQQVYRPHILSSPIVGVMQQQPRPSPSSSSSHVFSHFLPPMAGMPPGTSQHASSSRLSPGLAPALQANPGGERRGGGGESSGSSGGGHLKWEMPRPCPVCRRIYSNNSNLRRHLRTIHEEYYETHMQ